MIKTNREYLPFAISEGGNAIVAAEYVDELSDHNRIEESACHCHFG